MDKEYGLLYGLTNPYFNGLVKIGVTRNLDVTKRMRVLGTAVPKPFACAFAYKVPINELFTIERTLHENYEEKRIEGSEFFKVDPAKVINLMNRIGKFESMTSSVQDVINNEEERKRKPTIDFIRLGLRAGDTLYYTKDRKITCTIVSSRKVVFNGSETSLSSVTKQLLGYAAQPSPHWETEDGTPLITVYNHCLTAAVDKAIKSSELACDQFKAECHA